MSSKKPLVAIIMGSLTDYKIMKQAEEALKEFKIPYQTQIVSAHRMVHEMVKFAETAHTKGFKVIIAGAGAAAHLPGMVASLTPLPVIGVPVTVNTLKGLDALLSIAQMPKGIPVATVAIDNAFNAGLLAARMLSVDNNLIMKKTSSFQQKQKRKAKKMTGLMLKQLAK
jgi:phosphoribosylaminoimidazole carboxylase PurE protein